MTALVNNQEEVLPKPRQDYLTLPIIILSGISLSFLCLFIIIFLIPPAQERIIKFPIHSILAADYSGDPSDHNFLVVDLKIIREVIDESYPDADQETKNDLYAIVLNQLKTPVPVVTPNPGSTAILQPTSSDPQSSAPTLSPEPSPGTPIESPTSEPTAITETPTPTLTPTSTATDIPGAPSFSILVSADPGSVNEPGARISYTITISNQSDDSVNLISLNDDKFGDLNGSGTCNTGGAIASESSYSCSFSENILGNGGTTFTNQISAVVQGSNSIPASRYSSTSVHIVDIAPSVSIALSSNPNSILAPSATVTYTVSIENLTEESITLISLTDDRFGNLAGQGTCKTNVNIAAGGGFSCTFDGNVSGAAGDIFTNKVTVSVQDDELNSADANDSASVSITSVAPPTLNLTYNPNGETIGEPGGVVTYSIRITNTSSHNVTLSSLIDDGFGNLNGQGNCATGGVIPQGSDYECSFTQTISGNAGTVFTNTLTAEVSDSGLTSAKNDDAVVTITDVSPSLNVSKTASVSSVVEPGENVTFTINVVNTSVEPVVLTSLDDNQIGSLAGKGTCQLNGSISAGNSYSCSYTAFAGGSGGSSYINTVTAQIRDDENNTVSKSDSVTVDIDDAVSCSSPDPVNGFVVRNAGIEGQTISTSTSTIQVVFNQEMATSGNGSVLDTESFSTRIENVSDGGFVKILSITYNAQTKTASLVLEISDSDWQPDSNYEVTIKFSIKNACDEKQDVNVKLSFSTQP